MIEPEKLAAFKQRLKARNEEHTDWRTHCRKCGAVRRGSLAQLRQPHCCAEVVNAQLSTPKVP